MSVGIRILISFFRFFNYVNTIFSFIFQLEKQCFKNKTQVCVGKSILTHFTVLGIVLKSWQLIAYSVKLSKQSHHIFSPGQQAQSKTTLRHGAGAQALAKDHANRQLGWGHPVWKMGE